MKKKKHSFARILFLYIPLGFVIFSLVQVVTLKFVPVYFTPLMAVRTVRNIHNPSYPFAKTWKPIDEMSSNLVKCAVVAEDDQFFIHNGFDFNQLKKLQKQHEKTGKWKRGGSTISQQTAKNCFTWCTRTWVRKGFEAYYTVLIELIWGKQRIMEVYLNVAEMGTGIFGAEAAAQQYYKIPAAKLSRSQAAAIICGLPNPTKRNPDCSSKWLVRYRKDIVKRIPNVEYPEWVK